MGKKITFNECRDLVQEGNEEALLADGFEDALIGTVELWMPSGNGAAPRTLALYDKAKCIDILVKRDGMSPDEAFEYLEYNTLGAYAGENTPAFATIFRKA